MTKIISDTSILYDLKQAEKENITVIPLQISINHQTYHEFEDIQSEDLLKMIQEGHLPTSSQPTIGRVLETYEKYQNTPILNITMADGLSGTYQSACMAKEQSDGDITVLNSKTLCGPHRYLVQKANALASEGKTVDEIIEALKPSMDHSISYLIPQDFDYLKRGGRCSKAAASVGGLLKLVAVMKLSEDGTILEKGVIARTYKKALQGILNELCTAGVDDSYKLYISHAKSNRLQETLDFFKDNLPQVEKEVLDLSCAFITQGGPGCVAIQVIKK